LAFPFTQSVVIHLKIHFGMRKGKVLCLGMSYADIEAQILKEGYRPDILVTTKSSVQQVVECVRRRILTEMDGRDLARCIAMEEKHGIEAFTVSQEHGSVYVHDKHLSANFNRSGFVDSIIRHFGPDVKFKQIILDYFWCPKGTWVMEHWSKRFFHKVLPDLVQVLEFPKHSEGKMGHGVIYLPFCFHCMRELVANIGILKDYFQISFVYKNGLAEHALWSGTNKIDPDTMQTYLGKKIQQEEIYCTFGPRDVYEDMEDAHVTKDEVIDVLRRIENFPDVRMIRLQPLAKHSKHKRCNPNQPLVGGFVGLKRPKHIQNGFNQMSGAKAGENDTVSTADESDSLNEESETEAKKLRDRIRRRKAIQRKLITSQKTLVLRRRKKPTSEQSTNNKTDTDTKESFIYAVVDDLQTYNRLDSDYKLREKNRAGSNSETLLDVLNFWDMYSIDSEHYSTRHFVGKTILSEDDEPMQGIERCRSRSRLCQKATSLIGTEIHIDKEKSLQFNARECPILKNSIGVDSITQEGEIEKIPAIEEQVLLQEQNEEGRFDRGKKEFDSSNLQEQLGAFEVGQSAFEIEEQTPEGVSVNIADEVLQLPEAEVELINAEGDPANATDVLVAAVGEVEGVRPEDERLPDIAVANQLPQEFENDETENRVIHERRIQLLNETEVALILAGITIWTSTTQVEPVVEKVNNLMDLEGSDRLEQGPAVNEDIEPESTSGTLTTEFLNSEGGDATRKQGSTFVTDQELLLSGGESEENENKGNIIENEQMKRLDWKPEVAEHDSPTVTTKGIDSDISDTYPRTAALRSPVFLPKPTSFEIMPKSFEFVPDEEVLEYKQREKYANTEATNAKGMAVEKQNDVASKDRVHSKPITFTNTPEERNASLARMVLETGQSTRTEVGQPDRVEKNCNETANCSTYICPPTTGTRDLVFPKLTGILAPQAVQADTIKDPAAFVDEHLDNFVPDPGKTLAQAQRDEQSGINEKHEEHSSQAVHLKEAGGFVLPQFVRHRLAPHDVDRDIGAEDDMEGNASRKLDTNTLENDNNAENSRFSYSESKREHILEKDHWDELRNKLHRDKQRLDPPSHHGSRFAGRQHGNFSRQHYEAEISRNMQPVPNFTEHETIHVGEKPLYPFHGPPRKRTREYTMELDHPIKRGEMFSRELLEDQGHNEIARRQDVALYDSNHEDNQGHHVHRGRVSQPRQIQNVAQPSQHLIRQNIQNPVAQKIFRLDKTRYGNKVIYKAEKSIGNRVVRQPTLGRLKGEISRYASPVRGVDEQYIPWRDAESSRPSDYVAIATNRARRTERELTLLEIRDEGLRCLEQDDDDEPEESDAEVLLDSFSLFPAGDEVSFCD